jgi:hypothetical protein
MSEGVTWTFAKTYANTAPHEYILEEQYPEFYKMMVRKIDEEGVDEPFTIHGTTRTYRYYKDDTHRYWYIEEVLNRCPLEQACVAQE